MRPRCSILTGGFDFSGCGDCTSCPPFKQAEMSSSELSAIVLQGIPCMRGLYTVSIPMEKTGRRGKLATSHSPARRGGSLAAILLLQALRAVAPDFRAGNRDFHVEIARDLFLQLFVQAALELAHLAASQACHVYVIPRPVRFVVVPVAAKMQQIQLVNQALFFKKINRAVNGNEVNAGVDFLRARQNLIHVQMLLGVIHHLQDHPPLPRHADTTSRRRLLKLAGCFCGVEPLTRGYAVGWRCSHSQFSARAAAPA